LVRLSQSTRKANDDYLWFQSHLGSIITLPGVPPVFGSGEFQSHLGSIITGHPFIRSQCIAWVSIPPWFDYHRSSICIRQFIARFQSHLGSIITAAVPA